MNSLFSVALFPDEAAHGIELDFEKRPFQTGKQVSLEKRVLELGLEEDDQSVFRFFPLNIFYGNKVQKIDLVSIDSSFFHNRVNPVSI